MSIGRYVDMLHLCEVWSLSGPWLLRTKHFSKFSHFQPMPLGHFVFIFLSNHKGYTILIWHTFRPISLLFSRPATTRYLSSFWLQLCFHRFVNFVVVPQSDFKKTFCANIYRKSTIHIKESAWVLKYWGSSDQKTTLITLFLYHICYMCSIFQFSLQNDI